MKLLIAGHRNSGKKALAAYIREHMKDIEPILPDEAGLENEPYEVYYPITLNPDGIEKAVILVNALDGPMPGTRCGIEFCKNNNIQITHAVLTHVKEFNRLAQDGHEIYSKKGLLKMIEIETLELISSHGIDDTAITVSYSSDN